MHDLVLDEQQQLLFVNTDFSCLATLQPDYSFAPIWQPSFISKLVVEDRCHLNGLAMVEGKAAYVTACSATNAAAAGEMVGLAIAELLPNQTAELLSLYVLPSCRRRGIGSRLVKHLERSLAERNYLLQPPTTEER